MNVLESNIYLEELNNVFSQAPVSIRIIRAEDYIVEFANDYYLDLVNKEADIIGKPLFEIFPELISQGLKTIIDNVFATGIPYVGKEFPLTTIKNKVEVKGYFNFTYKPIREHNGTISKLILVATDVTEQLKTQKEQTLELEKAVAERTSELQKANAELQQKNIELSQKNKEIIETREQLLSEYSRSLIEASHDPLFVISPKGKITDMNQAAIKVTGIVRQKLTGTNFYEYFTDPKNAREVYKEVFFKGFVTDYPLTIKDHKLTDVLFNGSVYKDEQGEVIGAVVVARDITEQKKTEQTMFDSKVMAETLTSVAENAKVLAQNAQHIAESAVTSKQQFLSNMSHEIRTPMNAIIGFTKVLLKTDLSEKQTEFMNAIKLSGDALIVLINDILDLAKVESGKMTFEQIPFKLESSISAMIHLFEPKIQEKNIKLIKEFPKFYWETRFV